MISKRMVFIGVVVLAVLALSVPAMANQIAQVSKFKGEAYIISTAAGKVPVDRIGQPLNNGDKIMVKDGEVEFLYTDGAMTTVSKNTQAVVTEQEEESSFWFVKKQRLTRRIKTFVGKIFHQSGSSIKYHIAETPTAVAAIRGSAWYIMVFQYTDASGNLVTKSFVAPKKGSNFSIEKLQGEAIAVISEEQGGDLPEDLTLIADFTINTPATIPGQKATTAKTGTDTTTEQKTIEDFKENISQQVQAELGEEGITDPTVVSQVQQEVIDQIISPSQ